MFNRDGSAQEGGGAAASGAELRSYAN